MQHTYKIGESVNVRPGPDHFSGHYFVTGVMTGGDYKLARYQAANGDYDVIMHEQRLEPVSAEVSQ